MPAEEISPIQGFKNGPNLVDFRPISSEKRAEEEKKSAPLGAPESVTSSPPEGTLLQRPNTEGILEEVAKMERQELQEKLNPNLTQGSQQQSPAKPASVAKDNTPTPPQPPATRPGS